MREDVLAVDADATRSTMRPGGVVSRRIAIATVDLPEPDSPTRPSVSPSATVKPTPLTAITSPWGVS